MDRPEIFVHETAVVDAGAIIGPGSHVWHFCHIMSGAVIGRNANLGQNVFVASGVVLGDRCKVQNNVSIYEGVTCDDDVFLGPSAVFTNIKNPRSAINRKGVYVKTHVEKGATIGANATIVCGIRLGMYCLIGAGSVVTRDVPAFALMIGNPARQAGWVSKAGNRLLFDANGKATCRESGDYMLDLTGVKALS